MNFFDAHFHLVQFSQFVAIQGIKLHGATCAHSPEEYEKQKELISFADKDSRIIQCFGIHPQNPVIEYAEFLKKLLERDEIAAVGEAGFDYFTDEFKAKKREQAECFAIQAELAASFNKPLIIHDRKALDVLFEYRKLLSKIPSVIFHSFAFGKREADSLLSKGINAYFSFGKPILNGAKKAIECVKELPEDKILFETDAPFQTLKGEKFTSALEIENVYRKACELRGIELENLLIIIKENFNNAFILMNT